MEEINREIFQMFADLQKNRAKQRSRKIPEGAKDQYDLPFETSDSFSTDPLGFLETSMKLFIEAEESFKLLRVINRHSPIFYQMAGDLEQTLSRLGSVCITKAIMEQQGQTFILLHSLTIARLREISAFIFRKNYAAFMESVGELRYNADALKLTTRFAALDRRLTATDDKIRLICEGKVRIGLEKQPGSQEEAAADGSNMPDMESESEPEMDASETDSAAPFAAKACAFPIDRSALMTAEGKKDPLTVSTQNKTEAEAPAEELFDEENLPGVSKDLVQQKAELISLCEPADWLSPQYEYALSPP